MISPSGCALDGIRGWRVTAPPGDLSELNLAALLGRVMRLWDAGQHAAVLLDAAETALVGLPARLPAKERDRRSNAVLAVLRAAGWQVPRELAPWMTLWADGRPTISLGIHGWMDDRIGPLWDPDAGNMSYHLYRWTQLTGGCGAGTPGVAGISLLRDCWAASYTPRWSPDSPLPGYLERCEGPYQWERQPGPAETVAPVWHTWDKQLAWLGAAGVTYLGVGPLVHSGTHAEPDPKTAGYWAVDQPTWNEQRLPNPLGHRVDIEKRDRRIWIATPTLTRLRELEQMGLTGPVRVHDSWTAKTSARVMRSWASDLTGVIVRLSAERDLYLADDDCQAARDALADVTRQLATAKAAYRQGIGLLGRAGTRVTRADWRHQIIAMDRANRHRLLLAIGQAENKWPTRVNVDAVTYPCDTADPAVACPAGIPLAGRDDRPGESIYSPRLYKWEKTEVTA